MPYLIYMKKVGTGANPATGSVTISGSAVVGTTFTYTDTIADADGLGPFSYQWNRDGVAIIGATSSTYSSVEADENATISLTISFVDLGGNAETVTSNGIGPLVIILYGPELVTNGTFDTDISGWSQKRATIEWTNGAFRARILSGSAVRRPLGYQAIPTEIGATYKYSVNFVALSGPEGSLFFFSIGEQPLDISGPLNVQVYESALGERTGTFVATATSTFINLQGPSSQYNTFATFDDVSLKKKLN